MKWHVLDDEVMNHEHYSDFKKDTNGINLC